MRQKDPAGEDALADIVVVCHSVVHHSLAKFGGGNVVGLLVGSGIGSKTPDVGCSRESWPVGAHWEAEGGHVVEGRRRRAGDELEQDVCRQCLGRQFCSCSASCCP
jgi:hypothetical protein